MVIATDGTVRRVEVVSGHPLPGPAALEAFRNCCTRRPETVLDGEPVEVATAVNVSFKAAEP